MRKSQLDLPGIKLDPTIAMRRGEAWVEQCADCGTLVCVSSHATRQKLEGCPACGCRAWWAQRLPVGPFREVSHA